MWICKEWCKTNVETLKTKCFSLDYPKKGNIKKHDESLSFDYPIYFVNKRNDYFWWEFIFRFSHPKSVAL